MAANRKDIPPAPPVEKVLEHLRYSSSPNTSQNVIQHSGPRRNPSKPANASDTKLTPVQPRFSTPQEALNSLRGSVTEAQRALAAPANKITTSSRDYKAPSSTTEIGGLGEAVERILKEAHEAAHGYLEEARQEAEVVKAEIEAEGAARAAGAYQEAEAEANKIIRAAEDKANNLIMERLEHMHELTDNLMRLGDTLIANASDTPLIKRYLQIFIQELGESAETVVNPSRRSKSTPARKTSTAHKKVSR